MTFAGDITAALLELRALAESLMVDTCTITAPGEGDPDPVTGDVPRVPVYSGRCKVQSFDAQESNPEAAGTVYTVQRYRVDVPVGSFAPVVGAEVTMTAVTLDPFLIGRKYRVVGLLHKSMATAYRMAVEEA